MRTVFLAFFTLGCQGSGLGPDLLQSTSEVKADSEAPERIAVEEIEDETLVAEGTVTVLATLEAGGSHAYVLEVPTARQVTITASSDLDTIAWLDDDRNAIDFDDDAGEGLNFHIAAFLEAGTYQVTVQGYSADEAGDYELIVTGEVVEDLHGDTFEDSTWADPLVSSVVRGHLHPGDVDYFAIPFPVATFTITTTGDVDTFGTLFDEDEVFVSEDDDSGENHNFSITYDAILDLMYLEIRGFDADAEGDYELVFNEHD